MPSVYDTFSIIIYNSAWYFTVYFQIIIILFYSLRILLFIFLRFLKDFNQQSFNFLLCLANFYINQFYIFCYFYVNIQILTCLTKIHLLDNHCYFYVKSVIFICVTHSYIFNNFLFLLKLLGMFLSIIYQQSLYSTKNLHNHIFTYILVDLGKFIFLYLGVLAETNIYCFYSNKCVYITLLYTKLCI